MSSRDLFTNFMIVSHQENTTKLIQKLISNFTESGTAKFIAQYQDASRKDIKLYFSYQANEHSQRDITINPKEDINTQILNVLASIPAFVPAFAHKDQNDPASDNKTIQELILSHQALFDLDSLRSTKSPVSFDTRFFRSDCATGELTQSTTRDQDSPLTDDQLSITSNS